MSGGAVLCPLSAVPDGGAAAAEADGLDLILLREGASVRAFENSCPHVGTPLDWTPGAFLSEDGRHLVCATHGALFRREDGACVFGPCRGDRLRPVPVAVRDGMVVLAAQAPAACAAARRIR